MKKTGLVTAKQIEEFIADHSVLKGQINSKEFYRKYPLRPSDMPWFLIHGEKGRRYVAYFFREDAWRRWPWMRPGQKEAAAEQDAILRWAIKELWPAGDIPSGRREVRPRNTAINTKVATKGLKIPERYAEEEARDRAIQRALKP
jgi:hypothetical protein